MISTQVETVAEDVRGLKDACTRRYEGGRAEAVARLRGVPPVGGKVLWATQLSRRLDRQMERLAAVLGGADAVARHPRGRALRGMADELLKHLDAKPLYDEWLAKWKRQCASTVRRRRGMKRVAVT